MDVVKNSVNEYRRNKGDQQRCYSHRYIDNPSLKVRIRNRNNLLERPYQWLDYEVLKTTPNPSRNLNSKKEAVSLVRK